MTALRQKMIKAMELRNLSKNTERYYLSAVTGLARYHQKSPDELTQEMIEDYLCAKSPNYQPCLPKMKKDAHQGGKRKRR